MSVYTHCDNRSCGEMLDPKIPRRQFENPWLVLTYGDSRFDYCSESCLVTHRTPRRPQVRRLCEESA